MPTYEFSCPQGHDFERFYRKISDGPAEVPCPVCGAVAARRVSGGAGLLFKGAGFYSTDYGKGGRKEKEGEGKAGEKKESDVPAPAKSGTSEGGEKPRGSDGKSGGPAGRPPSESK